MSRNVWSRLAGAVMLTAAVACAGTAFAQRTVTLQLVDLEKGAKSYWMGVECGPVSDESLRAQFMLAEGQGLIVLDVVPDSPAAKAGLERHDILVKAGGQTLAGVDGLSRIVAVGKKFEVEVVHAGQRKTVEVTPVERPNFTVAEPNVPRDIVRLFGDRLPPHIRVMRPDQPLVVPKFPEDYALVIEKQGSQPAKITVKKGEESWTATEGKYDDLPEEIRPHVRRMFEGSAFGMPFSVEPLRVKTLHKIGGDDDLARQVGELRAEMKEMQRVLQSLQKQNQQ